jgi:hypothetical protein
MWNYCRNQIEEHNFPYAHVPKPEIEKFMNQTEWEENTLTDIEQNSSPTSISQTINPQVLVEKRPMK